MQIDICHGWKDYELLDSGDGMRYERFGPYKTIRPDPQAIWLPSLPKIDWQDADVRFQRTTQDKGKWLFKKHLPEKWLMHWKDLSFWIRLTSFKHTGVFPEQSVQWEWVEKTISNRSSVLSSQKKVSQSSVIQSSQQTTDKQDSENRQQRTDNGISILNLFGYTGIATLAAAAAGAKVTHVDASKPSITWARDNQIASKLKDRPIRWILDDAGKFVEREIKRRNTYDAIIMDPPVYGHGPTGQIWKFSENFPRLMADVAQLLSNKPLFVLVNAYAISASSIMLENVMKSYLPQGRIEVGELALEETQSKRLLSTGIFARWTK